MTERSGAPRFPQGLRLQSQAPPPANAFSCVEIASAAPIEVPTVDKLSIRVLVDSQLRPVLPAASRRRRAIAPAARGADFRRDAAQ